jgi:hypothetical protein
MTITITAEERDALYDLIIVRLSGISDIWLTVCSKDYDASNRLGRQYSDELRLIVDDLGWGKGTGEAIELKAPPDVLHRVLGRLRDLAVGQNAAEEKERTEVQQLEERNRLVVEASQRVLATLDVRGATEQ